MVPSTYRLELWQTAWILTAVDGVPSGSQTTMDFNVGGVDAVVTITTPCGTTEMSVDRDSDGDSIGFWDPQEVHRSDCSAAQSTEAAASIAAIETIESWTVTDDDRIGRLDSSTLALTRRP